jgi:hypothetical protein
VSWSGGCVRRGCRWWGWSSELDGDFVGATEVFDQGIFFLGAGGALLLAAEFVGVFFVDLFGGRGWVVGDLSDHAAGVESEVNTADVADCGVEGAEDEFAALEFEGAAHHGVDGFHEGHLDGLLVLEEGGVVDARGGKANGAEHALVEVAELLSAKRGGAAADSGDLDMGAGFGRHKLFGPFGIGNNFFVVWG